LAGPPLEFLTLHPMASGQSSLLLTGKISWEEFPAYAECVVALIGGRLGTRADGGGERVWCVERGGLNYWITWDDLDPGVSIEPCDAAAGAAIEEIRDLLRQVSG
jgi:hypothetical protein